MGIRLTILGSGTSHGIPMIACDCPVCTSDDPHDSRTRTAAVFSYGDHQVLIDTPPELRLQCIACDVRRLDGVLFTHHHADHVTGLDDLRRFNALAQRALPVYGNALTLQRLHRMFDYAFEDDPAYPSAKPTLLPIEISGPFELFGQTVIPLSYYHGPLPVLGFRIGDMAYCPDCNRIPEATREQMQGLEVLVLDGLRRRPHPTHFNLAQAVEVARQIGARQTYFTHIAHELKHAETNGELPAGMALAYDGLVCEA